MWKLLKWRLLLGVCLMLGVSTAANAQYYWQGGNGNWNASNWSNDGGTTIGTIPNGAGITAYIQSGGTVSASNATLGYFNVGAIVVGDGLDASTTTSTLKGFPANGQTPTGQTITLLKNGVFTCNGDNNVGIDASFIVNGGTLTYTERHLNLRNSASELNTGTINTQNFTVGAGSGGTASYKQTGGTMKTTAAFTLAGGATNQVTLSGGTFNVSTFTKSTADSILTFSGGTMQTNSITLADGDTLNQTGGTLVTGYNGSGNLAITGNYTLNAGATLQLTGLLNVTGTATLNGTVDASAFNGIPQAAGAVLNLVTAGTLAGTSTVSGLEPTLWTTKTENNSIVATYTGADQVSLYWKNNTTTNPYTSAQNWQLTDGTSHDVDLRNDPYASLRNLHVYDTTGLSGNGLNLGNGTSNQYILGGTLTIGNGDPNSTTTASVYRPGQFDLIGTLNVNTNGTFQTTSNGAMNIGVANGAGVAVVDGGTITSTGAVTVGSNATTGAASSLTIKSGSFTSSGAFNANNGSTVNLEGGSLSATGNLSVNNGTLTADGGTLTTSARLQAYGNGVINIKGDAVVNANGAFYTGTESLGTVNQSGGTVTVAGQFAIGWGTGKGVYNLSGGTLTTTGEASVWDQPVSSEFNMTGGTANFNGSYAYAPYTGSANGTTYDNTSFVVGARANTGTQNRTANSVPAFNLYAGTVTTVGSMFVDRDGTLNISKNSAGELGTGTMNIGGALYVRSNSTVNLSSGALDVTGNTIIGFGAAGTFEMTGGTADLNTLRIGDWTNGADAVLTVSGGTMNIVKLQTSLQAPSTVTISQADAATPTIVNAGEIQLGVEGTGATTFTLADGTLNVGSGGFTQGTSTGSCTLNLDGGTLGTFNAESWSSALNATVGDGKTVTFAPSTGATITWSGNLSGSGSVAISGAGTVMLDDMDLGANSLNVAGTLSTLGKVTTTGALELASTGTWVVDLDQWSAGDVYENMLEVNSISFNDGSSIKFTSDDLDALPDITFYFLEDESMNVDTLKSILDFSEVGGEELWNYSAIAGADGMIHSLSMVSAAVPEPSTWALMLLGLLGMGYYRLRRTAKA
ncbi:MAG: PEP-CTERM sorting domain-containing protein [Planctomycetia bacterium]|nr:PEP-CTERM sorting domain-containing protein [Planctomycetia bacterium]